MRAAIVLAVALTLCACGEHDRLIVPSPSPTATVPTPGVSVEETATQVTLRSSAAAAVIDKGSAVLTLQDAAGVPVTAFNAPLRLITASGGVALGPVHTVRIIDRGAELTCNAGDSTAVWRAQFVTPHTLATQLFPAQPATVTRVVASLAAAAGERFYGLMERIVDPRPASEIAPQAIGALDRRGQSVTMTVTPTMSLYAPLLHSSRGYGIYVDGTMTGKYDLAKTDPNAVGIDFEFNQRTGAYGLILIAGDHGTILDEYTALTGRPLLPPRWGFRHLRWRDEHRIAPPAMLDGVDMNADLVNDLTMYESLGIPAGNYEFDRPWTPSPPPPPPYPASAYAGFGSFSFDPQRFPNSDTMLQSLHARGFHVFVWVGPWALGDFAAEATASHYLAPRSELLIDYTNPAAAAWWSAGIQSLADLGIDGLKLDRSEFDVTELLDAIPNRASDVFADGRNGREMINAYTVDFARVHYDAMADRRGGDFLNYLRAGYAGSQQYGMFWGGDSPGRTAFGNGPPTDLGLRAAMLQLANVAFLGYSLWGTDTGGYYQFGQRDVFARWLEFSAICPLMEIGGGNQGGGQHAPWDMPTTPAFDSEMIDIYRRYIAMHHEWIPLLYSLAVESHATGGPITRPLVFDYPDDPNVGDLWDEFLLGHDLLAAPLWQDGARDRMVYLPAGDWIDYWDPTRAFAGPTTFMAEAPLDMMPMYIRRGAILPLDVTTAITGNGSPASSGRLTLDTYPDAASSVTLHEEDGNTMFSLTAAECGAPGCAQLAISPTHRGFIVRMLRDAVESVVANGTALPQVDSFAMFEQTERGWFFDAGAHRLWAKLDSDGGALTLRIR